MIPTRLWALVLSFSLLTSFPISVFAQTGTTPDPEEVMKEFKVVCPAGGCIDDPTQKTIIQELRQWIYDVFHGGQNLVQRFFQLIKKLFTYLKGIFFQIDQQIEASKCHNEDCTDYGCQTPTPGGAPNPGIAPTP